MTSIILDYEGWEVSAHRHTPMGSFPELGTVDQWTWQPVTLPFDAISWLAHRGHGPDPLVSFGDTSYSWTEDVDWVLRQRFSLPAGFKSADDEAVIVFKNLDCYFDAFLNGQHIGKGRNQFREHALDVDEALFRPENEIIIYIRSARNVTSMMEAAHGQLPAGYDKGRVHARRCQSLTGWDWTPRLSSVSLLSPPEIRPNSAIQITSLHLTVTHLSPLTLGQKTAEKTALTLTLEILSRRRASGTLTFRLRYIPSGDIVFETSEHLEVKARPAQIRRQIDLSNAEIWWPFAMGAQPLYKAEALLEATDKLGYSYELVTDTTFGIRTATIDRQKDSHGESFTPQVNGHPVFCRGANWIPVNMLQSRVTPSDYRLLINAAIGAGMNCLRVWGGGIYEVDEFYQLCDESGILVWQDFMFACAAYPTYRNFLDEVEAEAVYQVVRLRNHPCILLWCGNNENEWLHQTGDLRKGNEQKIIGETIWSHLIRQVIEDYDASRYYHQSSPYGKSKIDLNDTTSGDRHSWDGWSGWQSSDVYLQDRGRFITEFGFQSLPSIETIQQFAPTADSMNAPELMHHQKMVEGQERLVRYTAHHYNLPQSLDEWTVITQKLQAEVLRRAVEHWRRIRFHTSGALVWQLHDAYPAISWSMIDAFHRPKLAYSASKHFFAPVLLTMELVISGEEASTIPPGKWQSHQENTGPEFPVAGGDVLSCKVGAPTIQTNFIIVNDTNLDLTGELIVNFLRSDNQPVVLETVSVQVEPNASPTVLTHEIGTSLLQDIQNVTIHASWNLDETSRSALAALGDTIRDLQTRIAVGIPLENWLFDEAAGLSFSRALVEPKYYSGSPGI